MADAILNGLTGGRHGTFMETVKKKESTKIKETKKEEKREEDEEEEEEEERDGKVLEHEQERESEARSSREESVSVSERMDQLETEVSGSFLALQQQSLSPHNPRLVLLLSFLLSFPYYTSRTCLPHILMHPNSRLWRRNRRRKWYRISEKRV